MKVNEILSEGMAYLSKPFYNADKGTILGGNEKWLKTINATKDDVASAVALFKKSEMFKKAIDAGLVFVSTKQELANGTLAFKQKIGQKSKAGEDKEDKYVYNIYTNGQIRQYPDMKIWSGKNPKTTVTRLKSPKPKLVAGDPVKSIVATYEQAVAEVLKKYAAKVQKSEKA